MKHNSQTKRLIAVLLLISLICCALFAFLPHTHNCIGLDCLVCTVIKTCFDNILCIAVFSIALCAPGYILLPVDIYIFAFSMRECTPVGRKVKLSD